MCSAESNTDLEPTCKFDLGDMYLVAIATLRQPERRFCVDPRPLVTVNASFTPPTAPDPALLLELKTRRTPSLLDRAGCETWSVDFSPDGAWFAWSMGHGIVWVVAWPLDSK